MRSNANLERALAHLQAVSLDRKDFYVVERRKNWTAVDNRLLTPQDRHIALRTDLLEGFGRQMLVTKLPVDELARKFVEAYGNALPPWWRPRTQQAYRMYSPDGTDSCVSAYEPTWQQCEVIGRFDIITVDFATGEEIVTGHGGRPRMIVDGNFIAITCPHGHVVNSFPSDEWAGGYTEANLMTTVVTCSGTVLPAKACA